MDETDIAAMLVRAGFGPADAHDLVRLHGGRVNRVWRWQRPGGALAVKAHAPGGASPLFANDARAEHAALLALRGTGLAPEPAALLPGPVPLLLYRFEEGGPGGAREAGWLLGALHALPPPAFLPARPQGAEAVLAAGEAMLAGLPGARMMAGLRPRLPALPPVREAFLHGDPVPANIVARPGGAVLIDWQCPARGDPAEDLACFLSPAMQIAYAGRPLPAAEARAFLRAHGDRAAAARLRALAPAFHWRMAAYCLWRLARDPGDRAAKAGFEAEVAALRAS